LQADAADVLRFLGFPVSDPLVIQP
jgi:hypothetical protein